MDIDVGIRPEGEGQRNGIKGHRLAPADPVGDRPPYLPVAS